MNAEVEYSTKPQDPLAFDLSIERAKILQYNEGYFQTFLDHAHTYANETYARTPIVEYFQEIGDDGTLYFKETNDQNAPAADRVLEPYLNKNMPDWYRLRALAEHGAIKSLERYIKTAQPGDRFVEFSPAPFAVNEKLLEGTAFGRHSFARTYEVVYDQKLERNRLLGKAHVHYLTAEAQAQLFEELTGSEVSPTELLGTVGALPSSIDIESIQRIVASIPKELKVETPKNAPDIVRSKRIQEYISGFDHYLEAMFLMMRDPSIPEGEVLKRFQDWEKLISNFAQFGVDKSDFSSQDAHRMVDDVYYMTSKMKTIRDQAYVAWENSCGRGSGSSGLSKGTFEELTKALLGDSAPETKWDYHEGDCVNCSAKKVMVGPCNICIPCENEFTKKEQNQ